MTRDMIITELQNRGYKADPQSTIKNGVTFDGIRIMTESNVAPVIYTDDIIKRANAENTSLDEVVSAIISTYEAHSSVEFDLNELFNKEVVLSSLYIGLQRVSDEALIKRPCELEGIECYLYIRRDKSKGESYSIKLNKEILDKTNISIEEAWESAEANTYADTTLLSMASVMSEMFGYECEYDTDDLEDMIPMYVLSNKCKCKGASSILNKDKLIEFGKKYNVSKIIVLPSSIHEMLLVPYTEEMSLEAFTEMVSEVNGTEVAPEERLTDRAYVVTL